MKVEVNQLREENEDLKGRIRQLEKHHETMKGELKDMNRVVARQHGRTQVILNLLRSMDESHTSISPGTEHTRMPATATAVSMSMSTSGGVLDVAENTRVPGQTDHFREIPRTIPSPSHRPLELQGRDIHVQSGGDQYGERGHFPTRSAGAPVVRFSEQSDVQHIIGLDPVHSGSASAIVFGNLGQVDQATLMQSREVNRQTAPGLSNSSAGHNLGRHPRQWSRMEYGEEWLLAMSEGSHNPFPSPLPGQQASPDTAMSEESQDTEERPHLVGTASSRYDIHVESPGQQHDNGTSFEPAARGEFNDPMDGNEHVAHVGRRRGRSLSLGNDGDVQNSAAQGVGGFMRSQPGRGLENENDHEVERGPRGPGNRQGRRRGSDSAAFVHRGDRGGDADVEMRALPLAVPNETLERWSFDTAPLLAHGHGMVHGLAIGGLPPTAQTQTQDSNVIAMRRGVQ
ncbi:hypothetical protein GALMADRAFT_857273 [Galerina marginata CBS 339.88]|uniref:Uncharacterized protein n=1 Tax=Galerina marginata (strain CBS 339.88) TaxID=685588 RepID=A0A067TIC9_GALM3|nr:hypothetical protein GALMADRAFT_857273 [Galerina marginata CBS 339.88]